MIVSWDDIRNSLCVPVGKGKYGKVYEFFKDKRKVIKVVNCDEKGDDVKFKNELELTKLASVIGIGPPYVDGHIFTEDKVGVIIMTRGEPVTDWNSIIGSLEAAVYVMHSNGIWHQDLHLGNVMLFDKKPKIIDYGAAHRFRESIVGTILNVHDSLYLLASLGSLVNYEYLKSCFIDKKTSDKRKVMKKMILVVERLNFITNDPIRKTCRLGIVHGEHELPLGYNKVIEEFIKEAKFDDLEISPDQVLATVLYPSAEFDQLSKKIKYN